MRVDSAKFWFTFCIKHIVFQNVMAVMLRHNSDWIIYYKNKFNEATRRLHDKLQERAPAKATGIVSRNS